MFNNDYELLTYIMNEIKIYEEVFNEVYETAIKLKAYSGRKKTQRVEMIGYAAEKNFIKLEKKEKLLYELCNYIKDQRVSLALKNELVQYLGNISVFVTAFHAELCTIDYELLEKQNRKISETIMRMIGIFQGSVVEYSDIQEIHKI